MARRLPLRPSLAISPVPKDVEQRLYDADLLFFGHIGL